MELLREAGVSYSTKPSESLKKFTYKRYCNARIVDKCAVYCFSKLDALTLVNFWNRSLVSCHAACSDLHWFYTLEV